MNLSVERPVDQMQFSNSEDAIQLFNSNFAAVNRLKSSMYYVNSFPSMRVFVCVCVFDSFNSIYVSIAH